MSLKFKQFLQHLCVAEIVQLVSDRVTGFVGDTVKGIPEWFTVHPNASYCYLYPFQGRVKSHLPSAGIITLSPYFPH